MMVCQSVTIMVYISSVAVAALLSLTFVYQFFLGQITAAFAPAASTHALPLGASAALIAGWIAAIEWAHVIEDLHYHIWVLSIYLTLKSATERRRLPNSLRLLIVLGWPLPLAALPAALADVPPGGGGARGAL